MKVFRSMTMPGPSSFTETPDFKESLLPKDLRSSELIESFMTDKECNTGRLEVIRQVFLNENKEPLFEDVVSLSQCIDSLNLSELEGCDSFIKKLQERKITFIQSFPAIPHRNNFQLTQDGICFLIVILKNQGMNWEKVTLHLDVFEKSDKVFLPLFKQIGELTCVKEILMKTHPLTDQEKEELEVGFKVRDLIDYPLTIEAKNETLSQSKQLQELLTSIFQMELTQTSLEAKNVTHLRIESTLLKQHLTEKISLKRNKFKTWNAKAFLNLGNKHLITTTFTHKLTSSGIQIIIKILEKQTEWTDVTLNLNSFAPPKEGFSPLLEKLKDLTRVTTIDLSQQSLSEEDFSTLFATLNFRQREIGKDEDLGKSKNQPLNVIYNKNLQYKTYIKIFNKEPNNESHSLTDEEKKEELKRGDLSPCSLTIESKSEILSQNNELKEFLNSIFEINSTSISLEAKDIINLGIERTLLEQSLTEKISLNRSNAKNSRKTESLSVGNKDFTPTIFTHKLTSNGIQLIIEILEKQTEWANVTLNLNSFAPPKKGFSPLLEKLKDLTRVTTIDLSKQFLSVEDSTALIATLRSRQSLCENPNKSLVSPLTVICNHNLISNVYKVLGSDLYEFTTEKNLIKFKKNLKH